jgi:hypothetical protein
MQIKFEMDGIKNLDLLYTWIPTTETPFCEPVDVEESFETEELYHGKKYCQSIITDTISTLSKAEWEDNKYLGQLERIANETFLLQAKDGQTYIASFGINTYEDPTRKRIARLDVLIKPDGDNTSNNNLLEYDHKLEELKIAIKNRLLKDWDSCTWIIDEQSADLCKAAYLKAFTVENNLRGFTSKVLIHFLGVNWLKRAGFEKTEDSVRKLEKAFTQRVPEFDDINTDFLSMTLETLAGVITKGVVYKDDTVLSRQEYDELLKMCNKKGTSTANISDFLHKHRQIAVTIWDDLFKPYMENPDGFRTALTNFISGRNHVDHSKVLSWSAYQKIVADFDKMDAFIQAVDEKYESEEASNEIIQTLEAIEEQKQEADPKYEEEYYRYRLSSETGIEVLDEQEIADKFDVVLHELYSTVYKRYNLDVCYEVSDFESPNDIGKDGDCFSIVSTAVETAKELSGADTVCEHAGKISVSAEYSIDDERGESSICYIRCIDKSGTELFNCEVTYTNGDGYEGDEGQMEPSIDSELDDSALEQFKKDLLDFIDDDLNPYPQELEGLSYESKGFGDYVLNSACEQCGKHGISINQSFYPIGYCCYCGYENEIRKCQMCGNMYAADEGNNRFCKSCLNEIEKAEKE